MHDHFHPSCSKKYVNMPETLYKKKLIEVALPLPEINDASAYDKMPGIGPHPKGIHHWWARLPLPTARAVLFASVVTDPSDDPAWADKTEEEQDARREELFDIIRKLMGKRLHEHPEVYAEARAEMLKHCDGKLPPVLDPFAGGGSIPLEAARLGFEAHAADLNPVAVLLNKCNLEIAPRWANHAPVNPKARAKIGSGQGWRGTQGLAADVRYYGNVIRERALKKVGHLYPKIRLPKEHGGGEANVIAWIWARTVASQDPAAQGTHVPLISTYWLYSKGDNKAWLEPVVDRETKTFRFRIMTGEPQDKAAVRAGTKLGRSGFRCLLTGTPIPFSYLRTQYRSGLGGSCLVAIVADGPRGRIYLPACDEHNTVSASAVPTGYPESDLPQKALGFRIQNYGFEHHWQMFTRRQLATLSTISEAVRQTLKDIGADARKAGMDEQAVDIYAADVTTFLSLATDRTADFNNSFTRWSPSNQKSMNLFGRQAIPMVWDFAEANTLANSVGGWKTCCDYVAKCIEVIGLSGNQSGYVAQRDAASDNGLAPGMMVSTDPPYYDNIGYAALSDFFYVWLRSSIGQLHRPVFDTLLVPKMPELTASPERFDGDSTKAKDHFETGFLHAFTSLRNRMNGEYPLTVYYAFKQEDDQASSPDDDGQATSIDLTTGWETLLEALISSGFTIGATCPVRASQAWRMRAMGSNALASYIVLACRPRPEAAQRVGRNAFVSELKRELPAALRHLQQGNVAPVDFAQAAIGPGMAVFSRYSAVLESNGKPMTVRTALALINGIKDELLGEAVEELDRDTRWAVTWFAESGFGWGESGQANLLANAHATAVNGLVSAGLIEVKGNQVRLLRPDEMPQDWDPAADKRLTVWEMTHHLLRVYVHQKQGDAATAMLMGKLGSKSEVARDLAYKLFTVAEAKGRSKEAQGYNALVMGWPELARLSRQVQVPTVSEQQLPGME